jgi:hypothetical protein
VCCVEHEWQPWQLAPISPQNWLSRLKGNPTVLLVQSLRLSEAPAFFWSRMWQRAYSWLGRDVRLRRAICVSACLPRSPGELGPRSGYARGHIGDGARSLQDRRPFRERPDQVTSDASISLRRYEIINKCDFLVRNFSQPTDCHGAGCSPSRPQRRCTASEGTSQSKGLYRLEYGPVNAPVVTEGRTWKFYIATRIQLHT